MIILEFLVKATAQNASRGVARARTERYLEK